MGKFGFITWAWNEELDLAEIKKIFGETVVTSDIASDSPDSCNVVVHTGDLGLKENQWAVVKQRVDEGDKGLAKYRIPDSEIFLVNQTQLQSLADFSDRTSVIVKGKFQQPKPFTVDEHGRKVILDQELPYQEL